MPGRHISPRRRHYVYRLRCAGFSRSQINKQLRKTFGAMAGVSHGSIANIWKDGEAGEESLVASPAAARRGGDWTASHPRARARLAARAGRPGRAQISPRKYINRTTRFIYKLPYSPERCVFRTVGRPRCLA